MMGDQAAVPPMHEAKKSTEWVLADWAVRNGVQSTTRYRKGNPSRSRHSNRMPSGGHGFHYGFENGRVSTKATSGRKGGCATSRSRLRSRHHHHYAQQPSPSHLPSAFAHDGMPLGPHPIRPIMLPGMFPPHYPGGGGADQLMLPRLEPPPPPPVHQMGNKHETVYSPLTPETTAAPESTFGMMLPEPGLAGHHHEHQTHNHHNHNHNHNHNNHGEPGGSVQDVTTAGYSLVNGSGGGQGSSMYSQFPYGANDMATAGVYHHAAAGGYRDLPTSSSHQGPLVSAAGGNGHHFGTLDGNESYEWTSATTV